MPIYTCGKECNPVESPNSCQHSVKTYEGAVLDEFERNMHDDSDFYAVVWDEESQSIKTVMWATTRGWTYHNNVKVDATPEVIAKAEAWLADSKEKLLTEQILENAADPTVGKTVRSLTTRGKNRNAVGTIVKREANPYHTYYSNGYNRPEAIHNQRVLVQIWGEWNDGDVVYIPTGDERLALRWMEALNVEVVDPEHNVAAQFAAADGSLDPVKVREHAEQIAAAHRWTSWARG